MLKENADKEFEPLNPLPVKCIRITGANVLALQDPSAGQTQSDSPKVNKTVAKVSRKRSYDSFEQESAVDSAYDQRLKRRLPPQLPPRMLGPNFIQAQLTFTYKHHPPTTTRHILQASSEIGR